MSILSCETFLCDQTYVKVYRKKNSVDIEFEQALVISAKNAGSSITIGDGTQFVPGQHVTLQNNNDWVINATGATNTVYNASSQFKCLGFRFFFHGDYLKCVKKEVSDYYTYSVTAVTTPSYQQPFPSGDKKKIKCRESFYHPAAFADRYYTDECKKYILEALLSLAKERGIEVPEKFQKISNHHNGFQAGWQMLALDWLAYPLVREIDNTTICKNMLHTDRNFIAPNFEAKSFKQLIQHYYGTCTPKMLEEIWKVVTVGGDFRRTVFSSHDHLFVSNASDYVKDRNPYEVIEEGHDPVLQQDYIIQTGNRHIQTWIYTLGPAIFKTMGFDYFYQAIPFFGRSFNRRFDAMDGPSAKVIEFDFTTLLKHITPKKLITALFEADKEEEERKKPDLHSVRDTARMLNDYDSFEKIPPQLRMQYPTGLRVDFKFKTLKELHDKISTQYTIIKTEESKRPIPVTYLYSLLHGREKNGLKLHVPNNTATLAVWGKLLNICIASYGDRAIRGDTLLLGVEEDDRIKYCIEFSSVVVPKLELSEETAQLIDPNKLPEIKEQKIERHVFPRLEQKHVGVTPPDTPEEDEYYYIPSMIQFRSERNGDPTKDDRNAVEGMLIDWAKENIEILKGIKGIFGPEKSNGSLNIDMLNDAMRYALQDNIAPQQIFLNPRDLNAFQNLMRPAIQDPGPPPELLVPGINVIANPYINPGDIYLQPNGDLPVMINNVI